jgi:hypothetical protein
MPLTRLLALALAAVALAAAVFFATRAYVIAEAPRQVMARVEAILVERAGGWNACGHNRNFGPVYGSVARANPDSIVSSMAYDLADGPVRITGETWPAYWSLSLYQQNSDNYFVINDQQLDSERFDFVIARDGQDVDYPEATVVTSPTDRGIMLIRRFVARESEMLALRENQDQMYCGPAASS